MKIRNVVITVLAMISCSSLAKDSSPVSYVGCLWAPHTMIGRLGVPLGSPVLISGWITWETHPQVPAIGAKWAEVHVSQLDGKPLSKQVVLPYFDGAWLASRDIKFVNRPAVENVDIVGTSVRFLDPAHPATGDSSWELNLAHP